MSFFHDGFQLTDDDQLFEMKHKRNRSKSFNNGALKMGLPDSASDEKAN